MTVGLRASRLDAPAAVAAWLVAAGAAFGGTAPADKDLAAPIVETSGVRSGLCVHVGCTDGKLAAALGQSGRFVVHALSAEPASVEKARGQIRSLGLYGRVSAGRAALAKLPYADHLVNLLVVDDLPRAMGDGLSLPEVRRVLAPRGVALLGGGALPAEALRDRLAKAGLQAPEIIRRGRLWARWVKPRPAEMGDWPCFDYGPEGNPVSGDLLVGPATSLRWRDAVWSRHTVSLLTGWVTANGRMFHCRRKLLSDGHRVRYTLEARDAHNGLPLWSRPMAGPLGGTYGDRNVLAAGDRLYLPLKRRGPLAALDAATGKTLQTYAGTAGADCVVLAGGRLFGSSWRQSWAIDPASGRKLWANPKVGGPMVFAEGQLLFGSAYPRKLTSLDPATGAVRWQNARGGTNRYNSPLVYRGTLVLVKPVAGRTPRYGLYMEGFSAADGRELWTFRPKQIWRRGGCYRGEVFAAGGLIWAHVDVEANPAAGNAGKRPAAWVGLDPATGKVARRFDDASSDPNVARMLANGIHRCNAGRATVKGYLFGTCEFFDWKTGRYHTSSVTRAPCGVGAGMMPANGLVYVPPPTCTCRAFIRRGGFLALAHRPGGVRRPPGRRLQAGPAFGAEAGAPPAGAGQWPCYRHDPARSGSTEAPVPPELRPLWQAEVGRGLTAPVIAAGLVVAAAGEVHRVVALDAATGRHRWAYTAGGRIDSPPTVCGGRVLFGCRDGWVYCLRAGDGELAWRFPAAPTDELIVADGQLESPWPVHGSVLVFGGVAYAAAGRHSGLDGGVTVWALRPADGAVVWTRQLEKLPGPLGKADGPVALLTSDGKAVCMGRHSFDPKTGQPPEGRAGRRMRFGASGFLDHNWSQFSNTKGRLRWTDGRAAGELLASGLRRTCGVNALRPGNYRGYGPQAGMGHYRLFGKTRRADAGWSVQVPLQMRAMVLAGETVFVAGRVEPDLSEARKVKNPNRRAALIDAMSDEKLLPRAAELWAFSAGDGTRLSALKLDAAPVFDGLAAAAGRLYLAGLDGQLRCFGAKQSPVRRPTGATRR